jgi:hypothetical protein
MYFYLFDFYRFDVEHTQDEEVHLDCFYVIAAGIEVGSVFYLSVVQECFKGKDSQSRGSSTFTAPTPT